MSATRFRATTKFAHDDAVLRAEENIRTARALPLGDVQGRARLRRDALDALEHAVDETDLLRGRVQDGADGRPGTWPPAAIARTLAPALEVLLAADNVRVPSRQFVNAVRTVDAVIAQIPLPELLCVEVRHHLSSCAKFTRLVELATADRDRTTERAAA